MNELCPICHASCQPLRSLAFPHKPNLPQQIVISVCGGCDFAFSSPRDAPSYSAFYSANLNDTLGADINLTAAEKKRYSGQMEVLQSVVGSKQVQRVLDVGCGQAGLLRTLQKHYPNHAYFAVDPNVSEVQMADPDISFSRNWENLDGSFDLIILSHVIEHVVEFDEIAMLSKRLTETGHIYIEVPDASRYGNYLRQEFLYYFDRLHINHFTDRALRLLVSQWGLHVVKTGRSEFEYKDANPYPAIFVMANRQVSTTHAITVDEPLQRALQNYVSDEMARSQTIRKELSKIVPIVAYGFGDNFFKSVSVGGPLEAIPIAAIIDMRHTELNLSPMANSYRFMDIDSCTTEFPEATYVVSVSWGSLEIREALKVRGITNIVQI